MQRARCATMLATTVLLAACAGTPAHHGVAADPDNDDFDANKVDTVTQWAHLHGATVVWVNYPVKHRPRDFGTAPATAPGQ